MTSLILYYLKVNIALAILYIFYRLFFRNDTFFGAKRIVLLSIYLIAFLYPFADLSIWLTGKENILGLVHLYTNVLFFESPVSQILPGTEEAGSYDWTGLCWEIGGGIYLLGFMLLLFRCIVELVYIVRLMIGCKKERIQGTWVYVMPRQEEPFSFFRCIFIHPASYKEDELKKILIHESAHVCQGHSVDVVLSQLVVIFCWINPFAWALKREIVMNHEFLADRRVVRSGYDKKEYQYCLIGKEYHAISTAAANLYNHFSVLPLKKRIIMLNKKRTQRFGQLKYLLFIPVTGILLLLSNVDAIARVTSKVMNGMAQPAVEEVSVPAVPQEKSKKQTEDHIFTVVEKMPAYPGGEEALKKYIEEHRQYPKDALEKGKSGRVVVTFIIDKDGSISDVEVLKGVYPSLDKEAERIISSLPEKWIPGEQRGVKVKVKYTVLVMFTLPKAQPAQ